MRVGDVVKPVVKLSENGTSVSNATVKAIILKPGADIGDLLARAQTNALPTPLKEERGTCGDQKYAYLQAN